MTIGVPNWSQPKCRVGLRCQPGLASNLTICNCLQTYRSCTTASSAPSHSVATTAPVSTNPHRVAGNAILRHEATDP